MRNDPEQVQRAGILGLCLQNLAAQILRLRQPAGVPVLLRQRDHLRDRHELPALRGARPFATHHISHSLPAPIATLRSIANMVSARYDLRPPPRATRKPPARRRRSSPPATAGGRCAWSGTTDYPRAAASSANREPMTPSPRPVFPSQ